MRGARDFGGFVRHGDNVIAKLDAERGAFPATRGGPSACLYTDQASTSATRRAREEAPHRRLSPRSCRSPCPEGIAYYRGVRLQGLERLMREHGGRVSN